MLEVGSFEAKNKLSALLDAVERGDELVITRRGKPVARLVSANTGVDRARSVAAAKRIIALRKGVTLGPDISLKDLIDEGRRSVWCWMAQPRWPGVLKTRVPRLSTP